MVKMIFIVVLILLSTIASASTYSIEFIQVEDKIVVREQIDDFQPSYMRVEELEKSESGYFFIQRLNLSNQYDSTNITLTLDSGYKIDSANSFPLGYSVVNNHGSSSLIWTIEKASHESPFAIFVKIEKNFNYYWVALIIVILVILSIISIYYVKGLFKMNKKLDETYLLDEERKIIDLLKKSDRNEMWQNQIQKRGEFSKAKTSRLVRNLESRNLIKKVPFGNTNKIVLK